MTSARARTWLCIHTYVHQQAQPHWYLFAAAAKNLQNYSSLVCFAGRFGGQGGCGSIALNLPVPTAPFWFDFVAKASPRQAPALHVMMHCAPPKAPSSPVGSPRRGAGSATSQPPLGKGGGGFENWFRHLVVVIHYSLTLFDWWRWGGLKQFATLAANRQHSCLLAGF